MPSSQDGVAIGNYSQNAESRMSLDPHLIMQLTVSCEPRRVCSIVISGTDWPKNGGAHKDSSPGHPARPYEAFCYLGSGSNASQLHTQVVISSIIIKSSLVFQLPFEISPLLWTLLLWRVFTRPFSKLSFCFSPPVKDMKTTRI